jgi:hypothetical protein
MTRRLLGPLVLALGVSVASAQHQHSEPPPPAADVDVQECAQAQLTVERLLEQLSTRLETARLSNSPADMRAAIDGVQGTVRDLRAQLAPCAALQPADPHDGHLGHGATPPAKPATGPKKPLA